MPSYYSEEKYMGIISKTVKVKWHPTNKKHYEELGYIFTKWGDEFEVKVEDLTKGSTVMVKYECNRCGQYKYLKYYHHYLMLHYYINEIQYYHY